MLSLEMQGLLAKFLINICEAEESIDNLRKNFENFNEFDYYQAFQLIDKEKKNHINEYNIVEFLR